MGEGTPVKWVEPSPSALIDAIAISLCESVAALVASNFGCSRHITSLDVTAARET